MKTEFLKPRFTGARFDEHTLPVEVARDLAAYEELVVELAKHLYLLDHPNRQRVPKGFEQSFSLHLEQVEPGSARPVLAMVAAAGLALQGGDGGYFEQARDLVTECVSSKEAGQPLPAKFPKQLLDYFNVFGRSLRADEAVELPLPAGGAAALTPERRKALVLDAQKTYLREVELSGFVEEVDWARQTFRLRLEDGSASTAPFLPAIETLVRQAAGIPRTRVALRGVGVFDAYDKLQKVNATEHFEISRNHALGAQFETLANVKDGWMEGVGQAPPQADLEWLSDQLVLTFPADIAYPFVCPTPTGGVFLEWSLADWIVSAEFPLPERRCELQATNTKTTETVDEDRALNDVADFSAVYAFIRQFV